MEIPNELQQYIYSNEKYKTLLDDIQQLNCMAEKTTSILSDMPHNNVISDKVGEYSCMIADTKKKLSEQVLLILNLGTNIREKALSLKSPYQEIIYNRYILNKTLYHIADNLGYSYSHIKKLHNDSVKLYNKIQNGSSEYK